MRCTKHIALRSSTPTYAPQPPLLPTPHCTTLSCPPPANSTLPLPASPRSGFVQLVIINSHILFFQERDGPWFPTLRLLHQYPDMMPKLRADKGAIKFVLSGANIMCPGLTSPGATIHDEVRCCCPAAVPGCAAASVPHASAPALHALP